MITWINELGISVKKPEAGEKLTDFYSRQNFHINSKHFDQNYQNNFGKIREIPSIRYFTVSTLNLQNSFLRAWMHELRFHHVIIYVYVCILPIFMGENYDTFLTNFLGHFVKIFLWSPINWWPQSNYSKATELGNSRNLILIFRILILLFGLQIGLILGLETYWLT